MVANAFEVFTPNAGTGAWTSPTPAGPPPAGRYNFASTWTGKAFFIYGGSFNMGSALPTGALYSPADVRWTATTCGLPGCERGGFFTAFFDGTLIHIWGGGGYGSAPAGLSYDTTAGSWAMWTVPAGTDTHLAKRLADDGRRLYYLTATNVVSIYDRKTSSWLANDTSAMPSGFCTDAATAWTSCEMIAWSGACGGAGPVSVGGRYQPPSPP